MTRADTPLTEAGRRLHGARLHRGIDRDELLEAILAIEADLVAQIEKAVDAIEALPWTRDDDGGKFRGLAVVVRAAVLRELAAIRSAAPVEPES